MRLLGYLVAAGIGLLSLVLFLCWPCRMGLRNLITPRTSVQIDIQGDRGRIEVLLMDFDGTMRPIELDASGRANVALLDVHGNRRVYFSCGGEPVPVYGIISEHKLKRYHIELACNATLPTVVCRAVVHGDYEDELTKTLVMEGCGR